jgi:acyl carrier protein
MDEARSRLTTCFLAVFPSLARENVLRASVKSTEAWDSVATVTLIAAIEEEFGVEIDIRDMENLVSFDNILDYLRNKPTKHAT